MLLRRLLVVEFVVQVFVAWRLQIAVCRSWTCVLLLELLFGTALLSRCENMIS